MRNLFLILMLLCCAGSVAQVHPGYFGGRNSVGLSVDMSIFRLSSYTAKKLFIPAVQFTHLTSRRKSFTLELGMCNVRVKGNEEGGNDERHKLSYEPGLYQDVISEGTGKVRGTVFSAYRTSFWENLAPAGAYHSWGLHVASLKYKSDDFRYTSIDGSGKVIDTTYTTGFPKRTIISASISFGGRTSFFKTRNLIWDYGIRCRVPFSGFYKIGEDFLDGREYLVYHGVKSYIGSSFIMFYTGVHYAF